MSISIQRMSDAIGARLTGIDLQSGIDDSVMKEVHQAWLENFVIIIPGQDLSGDDQIAFTEWFGPRQEVRPRETEDVLMEPVTLLAEAVGPDKGLTGLRRDPPDGLDDCCLGEGVPTPVREQRNACLR